LYTSKFVDVKKSGRLNSLTVENCLLLIMAAKGYNYMAKIPYFVIR